MIIEYYLLVFMILYSVKFKIVEHLYNTNSVLIRKILVGKYIFLQLE